MPFWCFQDTFYQSEVPTWSESWITIQISKQEANSFEVLWLFSWCYSRNLYFPKTFFQQLIYSNLTNHNIPNRLTVLRPREKSTINSKSDHDYWWLIFLVKFLNKVFLWENLLLLPTPNLVTNQFVLHKNAFQTLYFC